MPRPKSKPAPDPFLHMERMESDLRFLDAQMKLKARNGQLVPDGWLTAHWSAPCRPVKEKVTMRLDADMVAWYRNLGTGYQGRVNEVLRAYMDAVISQYIPPDNDYTPIGPRE